MRKARMVKIGFVLGIGVIIMLGSMAVKAADNDMMKSGNKMKMGKEGMMNCTMNCEKNMKDTSEAMALLDEAIKAIDAGNTADAKMKIAKAKMMLNDMQMAQKKCMEKMPACNASCPISGKPIDMMNTPKNLTTMYKGKKVGFCCPACPPAWDKLSDTEKDIKLEESMPKMPEKEGVMKDMPDIKKMQEK